MLISSISALHASNPDSLIKAIMNMPEDTGKVWAYSDLSEIYEGFAPQRALSVLDKMEQLSLKIDYQRGHGTARMLKGRVWYHLQEPDSALAYYLPLLEHETFQNDKDRMAHLKSNIGTAYQAKEDYQESIRYLNESTELFKELESVEGLCINLNNLGINVYYLGDPEKSLEYFKDSYEWMVKYDFQDYLPMVVNNIAGLNYQLGNKDKVDSMFLNLLDEGNNKTNLNLVATVYLNLGSFYSENEELDKAEKYFLLSQNTFSQLGIENNAEVLQGLGIIYQKRGAFRTALSYYRKVLEDSPSFSNMEVIYKRMANLYESLDQADSAIYYWELLVARKDSIKKQEISDVLVNAQNNMDLLKSEAQINELEASAKILKASEERNRLINIFLFVLILLIGLSVWFYIRNERERKKVKQLELEKSQQRLLELSQVIARKNEVIEDIEKKLKTYSELSSIKEELSTSIKDSFNIEKDWEMFSVYFEDQHKGFYERLKSKFPSLTNNDLRICSLARMRMSTKEAASVLNLSIDAIKSSRYRIRKKLEISQEEDMSDFLNHI